jgi:hypothetical protein
MAKATTFDLLSKKSMTKTMNQSIGKESNQTFYVVTRNGRRAWSRDYWTISEAQDHAEKLIRSLKNYKDPDYKKVVIMETQDPKSIN